MSLFQVCAWWSAQNPDFESNYDSNTLHCCRLHSNESEKEFVIVGSHAGYVNIYKPSPNANNNIEEENHKDDSLTAFTPNDHILELKLSEPVLQLSSGRFLMDSSNKDQNQLVILHPFKLSVYLLQRIEGVAEHGNQFKLNVCFEHKLVKSAFSMCHGFFGGNKKREFFCVTHLDGTLTFFEQDGISFEATLFGARNIPSVFVYNHRIDSFLTVSASCELECFRYQDLGQVNDLISKTTQPAWTICVGETPLDIQIQQLKETESVIIVLGENNLYCISDNAVIKFIKRLDYAPVCFCTFVSGWYWEPDAKLIITVVSGSGSVLIYNSSILVWASQVSEVPVAIRRGNFHELPGACVTLGQTGKVNVSYLGTEPQLFQVPPLNLRKVDFAQTQKQLIELEKEIKAGVDFTDISLVNTEAERDINFQLEISSKLEHCTFITSLQNTSASSDDVKMVLVSALVKVNKNIEHMQIQFSVEFPLKCSKEVCSFQNITANNTVRLDTWVYLEKNVDSPTARITAIVSFINNVPRVIERSKLLPFGLFYKSSSAQKEAMNKLIISIENGTAPSVDSLFSEFLGFEDTSPGAVGFKSIYTGAIVTIILAKSSNRYRVQSDSLMALAVVLEYLINKIEIITTKYKDSGLRAEKQNFKITAMPTVPTDSIVALLNEHHTAVSAVETFRTKLQASASQVRLFERRLFIKLDEKKPNALNRMSSFLKSTHQQLMTDLQSLEAAKDSLKISETRLSSALSVTAQLIKLFDISPKITDGLLITLMSPIADYPQQSWEETVAASLDALNSSGILAKSKKTTLKETLSNNMGSFDFERFRRHLNTLLDRVCRIAQKGGGQADNDNNSDLPSTAEVTEESDWVYDVDKVKEMLLPS